jgi:hypothetical protein
MTFSDHVCSNFEPKNVDRWDQELQQHLCDLIDRQHAELKELQSAVVGLAMILTAGIAISKHAAVIKKARGVL